MRERRLDDFVYFRDSETERSKELVQRLSTGKTAENPCVGGSIPPLPPLPFHALGLVLGLAFLHSWARHRALGGRYAESSRVGIGYFGVCIGICRAQACISCRVSSSGYITARSTAT
jgi:hypothetical protein